MNGSGCWFERERGLESIVLRGYGWWLGRYGRWRSSMLWFRRELEKEGREGRGRRRSELGSS